jgi:hypothetical protein
MGQAGDREEDDAADQNQAPRESHRPHGPCLPGARKPKLLIAESRLI